MGRHDELRKTWREGRYWETCNDGMEAMGWSPVGNSGYAEPVWDEHQHYRQCHTPPDGLGLTIGNMHAANLSVDKMQVTPSPDDAAVVDPSIIGGNATSTQP